MAWEYIFFRQNLPPSLAIFLASLFAKKYKKGVGMDEIIGLAVADLILEQ